MGDEVGASRETDALIAEKVMGWTVNRPGDRHWHTVGPVPRVSRQVGGDCCAGQYYDAQAFMPSRDRTAALEVVDRLIAGGCVVTMSVGDAWAEVDVYHQGEWLVARRSKTLPITIVRAALDPRVLAALAHPVTQP